MRDTEWIPTVEQWVDAAPFAALTRHLLAETSLSAAELAAALRLPVRTVRALLSRNRRIRRIRWLDAHILANADPRKLSKEAVRICGAGPAKTALETLPDELRSEQALKAAGIDYLSAKGLAEGWLCECRAAVNWKVIAMAEEWAAARLFPVQTAAA